MSKTLTGHVSMAFEAIELAEVKDDPRFVGTVTAVVSTAGNAYQMGFREMHRMAASAFPPLMGQKVAAFFQHNHTSGTVPAGTLEVVDTANGNLTVKYSLFATDAGRSLFWAAQDGALKAHSIGYIVTAHEVTPFEAKPGFDVIDIAKFELAESSIVIKGANPRTKTLQVADDEIDVSAMADALVQANEQVLTLEGEVAELKTLVAALYEDMGLTGVEDKVVVEEGLTEAEAEAVMSNLAPAAKPPFVDKQVNDIVEDCPDEDKVDGKCPEVKPADKKPAQKKASDDEAVTPPTEAPPWLGTDADQEDALRLEEMRNDLPALTRVARAWRKAERDAGVIDRIKSANEAAK